jgi:hypothetical protein
MKFQQPLQRKNVHDTVDYARRLKGLTRGKGSIMVLMPTIPETAYWSLITAGILGVSDDAAIRALIEHKRDTKARNKIDYSAINWVLVGMLACDMDRDNSVDRKTKREKLKEIFRWNAGGFVRIV